MARIIIPKALASGLLAVAFTFGGAGAALAQPVDNADATASQAVEAVGPLNPTLQPLGDHLTAESLTSQASLSSEDIAALDHDVLTVLQTKAAEGEVVYTVNDEGKNVYQAEVPLGDDQIIQFDYEADPDSPQAATLSTATYSAQAAPTDGNEWYPKISVGSDSQGRWIRFNRATQKLFIGTVKFVGGLVKTAICAIPGAGPFLCPIVSSDVFEKLINGMGPCAEETPWLYVYPRALGASTCRASA